jgi:hypothetical protein
VGVHDAVEFVHERAQVGERVLDCISLVQNASCESDARPRTKPVHRLIEAVFVSMEVRGFLMRLLA